MDCRISSLLWDTASDMLLYPPHPGNLPRPAAYGSVHSPITSYPFVKRKLPVFFLINIMRNVIFTVCFRT